MQTKMVALLAGAALSLGTTALAQSSQYDRAADAERMGSLQSRSNLQSGGSGGMNLGGLVQFRYTANFRSDGTKGADTITKDDDFTHGFALGSTKLWAKGNLDNNLSYAIQGDFATNGGEFRLDDAFLGYKFNDNWSMKAGQFKLPLLREDSVSDQYQLSAQRSVTNEVFAQKRSQGVQFAYASDSFRAMVGFSDGWRSANTDFNSSSESDWAINGRVDFKWAGDWSRFDDFTSFSGDGNAGVVGAAIMYQGGQNTGDGTDGTLNTGVGSFLLYTIDAQIEGDGWNVFGALIGSHMDPDASAEDSTNAFGVVLQGGFFFNDNWEGFVRWDAIFADDNADGAANLDPSNFHFLTAGVNYYLIPKKHTMKFTADVVVGLNDTYALRSVIPTSGAGGSDVPGSTPSLPYTNGAILGDIDSGEFGLQLQFQVLF